MEGGNSVFFVDMFLDMIAAFFSRIINDIIAMATGVLANEHRMAMDILNTGFIQSAITAAQWIAGSLLAIKTTLEMLRIYILFNTGDSGAYPERFLQRVIYSAAMIVGSPWLAQFVFKIGAEMAIAFSQIPVVDLTDDNPLFVLVQRILFGGAVFNFGFSVILLFFVVFWLIIILQTTIRSVELAFACVSAPLMAIGLTHYEEGIWAAWWRNVVVLAMSQAVQMFFLTGFFSSIMGLVAMDVEITFVNLLLPCAWLYVAYRSPTMLKELSYHTGTGQMISGGVRSYVTPVIRSLITKGVR